jgi:hypothetical protein
LDDEFGAQGRAMEIEVNQWVEEKWDTDLFHGVLRGSLRDCPTFLH